MTKILRNCIIHEFVGVCYEYPNFYHERHDKRSRWEVRGRNEASLIRRRDDTRPAEGAIKTNAIKVAVSSDEGGSAMNVKGADRW